jgi:hypothetical protein
MQTTIKTIRTDNPRAAANAYATIANRDKAKPSEVTSNEVGYTLAVDSGAILFVREANQEASELSNY